LFPTLNPKTLKKNYHFLVCANSINFDRDLNLHKGGLGLFLGIIGAAKFPFWLYFSGTARLAAGQSQGCAGVGIVLVSPLKVMTNWLHRT
jgi:hypothetical protein